jgi:cysteine desulfurase
VGFGKAIEICDPMENERMVILQEMLINGIVAVHPDVQLNGSREYGLENNINASFSGLDAETIIGKMKGIACSTGSACSTANLEPSHVLKAIGLKNEMAHSSIRFSLGRFNTKEEIINAIDEINRIVSEMKDKSPRNL